MNDLLKAMHPDGTIEPSDVHQIGAEQTRANVDYGPMGPEGDLGPVHLLPYLAIVKGQQCMTIQFLEILV